MSVSFYLLQLSTVDLIDLFLQKSFAVRANLFLNINEASTDKIEVWRMRGSSSSSRRQGCRSLIRSSWRNARLWARRTYWTQFRQACEDLTTTSDKTYVQRRWSPIFFTSSIGFGLLTCEFLQWNRMYLQIIASAWSSYPMIPAVILYLISTFSESMDDPTTIEQTHSSLNPLELMSVSKLLFSPTQPSRIIVPVHRETAGNAFTVSRCLTIWKMQVLNSISFKSMVNENA